MTEFHHDRIATLTQFSLQRRITVLVLFLTILVVGLVSTSGIPLELFPSGFTSQSLRVVVPWRDSPSREVLDKITLPLEDELATVRGLDNLSSYSRSGQSSVWMSFKQGTDMNVAYREVRDRVERARVLFPDGVDRVFIRKDDISGIPVAVLGMAIDPEVIDSYNLVKKGIMRPFERIDGVASVDAEGLEEKEIIIEVDRFKAEGAGLNIYELAQQLGDDNFSMASGNVRDSGKKFLLRSVATYHNLQELENRLLRADVRLKDVAEVRYVEPERRWQVRVDSKPAIAMNIYKEGEANTVEVSRKIQATFEELQADPRLSSVDMVMLFNQGQVVEDSISTLTDSGKVGGLLAAIVLFLFLRRFRLTLIITLSIPLSLLMALSVMYFGGETLNLLSILALVICVGLLVDNSVVVAENIHRLHRKGLSRKDACVQGASDIALAIIMATLTTVVVFLPVALVEGQGQFFLLRMALPISVSLVASLFVALVFIPLCVYLTLPTTNSAKTNGPWQKIHDGMNNVLRIGYDQTFGRINHSYNKALDFFLRHRLDLILLVLAIAIGTAVAVKDRVEFVEGQEDEKASFNINADMGPEYSIEEIRAYFREIEKVLEDNKDRYGLRGYLTVTYPGGGSFDGWLDTDRPRKLKAKEIAAEMMELLPKRAGIKLYTGEENQAEEEDKLESFVVRLLSEDPDKLEGIAENLRPILLQEEGVIGIQGSGEDTPNELALVVDRDRATATGVSPSMIAGVVGYALQGSQLPRYNEDGKEIPVRIRYREEDREQLSDLTNFSVPTDEGDILPVSALTTSRMLNSAKGIFRRNKQISRTITLELEETGVKETRERLTARLASIDLPEGVQFGEASFARKNDDLENMKFALLLSVVFIYLLMGFLFESFILPLSIIVTIPLAIIGVYWGHLIMDLDMDFLGMVGMVLLVGVVVNNGIVFIDRVNGLRAEGETRHEAMLKAAEQRFRPIAMTALTTITGMIPLAVSKPQMLAFGEGFSYKSFGVALIGGMTTATMLTLLVVPVLYTLFDDARERFGVMARQALQGKRLFERRAANT